MFTNNIHLLQFKIQGHLQKRGLWMPMYQNSSRRKKSQICAISVAILLFFLSKFFNWLVILSSLESTLCDKTIKCVSNWFILAQITQNIEFINLKHVSYTQRIWVSLNSSTKWWCHISQNNTTPDGWITCTRPLRIPKCVVCKKHAWDWWTLDFALFGLEWTILKRVWWFYHTK